MPDSRKKATRPPKTGPKLRQRIKAQQTLNEREAELLGAVKGFQNDIQKAHEALARQIAANQKDQARRAKELEKMIKAGTKKRR